MSGRRKTSQAAQLKSAPYNRLKKVTVQGSSMPLVEENCQGCPGLKSALCGGLPPEGRRQIAPWCERLVFPAGRCFVESGRNTQDFHVLVHGHVKLFSTLPDGRRQITAFAHGGDLLGLVSESRYAGSVETLGEVILCRFSRSVVEHLARDFPTLSQCLRDESGRKMAHMQECLLLLGRKTARERLATFLIEVSLRLPLVTEKNGGHVFMKLPMPRSDIADYLGLTIETVSRQFSQFKRDKLIMLKGVNQLCLLDAEALQAIADGHD